MNKSNSINILIIEDNHGDQELLEHNLKSTGLDINNIAIAGTLEEAYSLLRVQSFNLILLDLFLPDSNGLNSFTELIKVESGIPVIILSGLHDKHIALKALSLGAQDYLIKGDPDNKLLEKSITYSIERIYNLKKVSEIKERLELVSKATNDMVWDWNLITNEVYRNREGWKKIFRIKDDDFTISKNVFDEKIHPEDRERIKLQLNNLLNQSSGQELFQAEFRILRNDGEYSFIQDRGYVLRNVEGKAIRIIGATQDINEQKQAEQILKSSEERYRYLFNNNPASIYIWDLNDLKIIDVNDTAIEEYGYSREEFLNMSILALRPGMENQKLLDFINLVNSKKESKFFQTWKHINKSGTEMFMDIDSHRIEYKGRLMILALAVNVTEKKLLEKKLKKEQVQKQKQITAAVIAAQEAERSGIGRELHDNVNQLLGAARMYIEMARNNSDQRESRLQRSSEIIMNAISDIRKLSKTLITPEITDMGLSDAIKDMIQDIILVHPLNINFNIKVPGEEQFMEQFNLNIFRIVQEQLNNIIKHAKAKTVDIDITLENYKLQINISDDGIGFDTQKKRKGMGISNIISRVQLYKGEAIFNTEPGNGCTLKIIFCMKEIENKE